MTSKEELQKAIRTIKEWCTTQKTGCRNCRALYEDKIMHEGMTAVIGYKCVFGWPFKWSDELREVE